MKAAMLSMTKYMAKLLGRYATLAWNMPEDVAMMTKNMMAMRGFRVAATLEKSLVSQRAQTKPSTIRRR